MPTNPIVRVRTVVTGVAGSPYYITGYFTADTGTPDQVNDAWHDFVTFGGAGAGVAAGSIWRTEGEQQVLDPVSGDIIETRQAATAQTSGSRSGTLMPPATQYLVRWRTGNYVAGREVRGRTNLPLVAQAGSDSNGQLSATTLNAVQQNANTLLDREDVIHVVWSRKNGLWWATSSASAWNQYSVLRSRRD